MPFQRLTTNAANTRTGMNLRLATRKEDSGNDVNVLVTQAERHKKAFPLLY